MEQQLVSPEFMPETETARNNSSPLSAQDVRSGEDVEHLPEFDPHQLLAPRLSSDNRIVLNILSELPDNWTAGSMQEPEADFADEPAALAEMSRLLQNLRPLTLRAANTGVLSLAECIAEQYEADAVIREMLRIATASEEESILRLLNPDHLGMISAGDAMLTLADVAAGGAASLRNGPALALRIVRQAQAEIQALQTGQEQVARERSRENLQALEATLANIRKTEAYLRNVQMALKYAGLTRRQMEEDSRRACAAQDLLCEESVLQLLQ